MMLVVDRSAIRILSRLLARMGDGLHLRRDALSALDRARRAGSARDDWRCAPNSRVGCVRAVASTIPAKFGWLASCHAMLMGAPRRANGRPCRKPLEESDTCFRRQRNSTKWAASTARPASLTKSFRDGCPRSIPNFSPHGGRRPNILFRRIGITFAVYGAQEATERLIPFDILPRIIAARRMGAAREGPGAAREGAEPLPRRSLWPAAIFCAPESCPPSSSIAIPPSGRRWRGAAFRTISTCISPASTSSAPTTTASMCWRTTPARRRASPTCWKIAK